MPGKPRSFSFIRTHNDKCMKKNLTIGASYLHAVKKALLIMKLTFLLLTVAMLHASAKVSGQARVTLKSSQEEIAGVLTTIEKQTSYRFLYNNALKGIRQKIDIDVRDETIQDVLNKVFIGTDLTYTMLENNLIVVLSATQAQDIQVTGKVTGENAWRLAISMLSATSSTFATSSVPTGFWGNMDSLARSIIWAAVRAPRSPMHWSTSALRQ